MMHRELPGFLYWQQLSEFKLLDVLYKWPAVYQVLVIVAYAPVPSLKTNVGLFFFTFVNSKNSDTGKMIN